jgi:hypothetical protein
MEAIRKEISRKAHQFVEAREFSSKLNLNLAGAHIATKRVLGEMDKLDFEIRDAKWQAHLDTSKTRHYSRKTKREETRTTNDLRAVVFMLSEQRWQKHLG